MYLDKDKYKYVPAYTTEEWRKSHNFVLGDCGKSPFRDHVFDAIFYQDNHANRKETRKILRTLKPEGIIIHSSDSCSDCLEVEEFSRMLDIIKVDLPFYNEYYTVFSKIE